MSSEELSKSNDEDFSDEDDLGGLDLYNSDAFDPDDYDDYELSIIYKNTIDDLFDNMSKMKNLYTEKIHTLDEKLRLCQQNESKWSQILQQSKQIINQLKEENDKLSSDFNQMNESYRQEQVSHNETIKQLNELKLNQQTGCANMTMCAALEIKVENGKVVDISMKENMDSVRDDALMQLNLMTKKVDELRRELNSNSVDSMSQKREVEKEKERTKELERKIELLEIDKTNLENDIKSKNEEIEDVKKRLEEELAKPRRTGGPSLSPEDREKRLAAVRERNKKLATQKGGINARRKQMAARNAMQSQILQSQMQQSQMPSNAMESTLMMSMAPTSVQPQIIPNENDKSMQNSAGKSSETNMMTSNMFGITNSSSTKKEEKKKSSDKKKVSRSTFSSKNARKSGVNSSSWSQIASNDKFKTIGINEEGLIGVTANENGANKLVIFKHKTFNEDYNLEMDCKMTLQTKHGYLVSDGNTVMLVVKAGANEMNVIPEGVLHIGESENGILIVNSALEVVEIIGKNKKTLMTLEQDDIDGNIYAFNGLIIYKETSGKIVTHASVLKSKFYSEKPVSSFTLSNGKIYCARNDELNKIDVLNLELQVIKTHELVKDIKSLINYQNYVIAISERSAYCLENKVFYHAFFVEWEKNWLHVLLLKKDIFLRQNFKELQVMK